MSIKVLINGSTADITGVQLPMNYQIADVAEPGQRSADYSQTIFLPASATNNAIFGHSYTHKIKSDENELKLLQDVQIFDGGNKSFDGHGRVKAVTDLDGAPTGYELFLFTNNILWYNALEKKYLCDLSFTDHDFDTSTIEASWSDTADTADFYYPIINYGGWSRIDYVYSEDLRPAIFYYSLLYKGITEVAGYEIVSDKINSDDFKRLAMQYFGKFQHSQDFLDTFDFKVRNGLTDQTVYDSTPFQIEFSDDSSPYTWDHGNHFNTTTWEYTAPYNGMYGFKLTLEMQAADFNAVAGVGDDITVRINLRKNGTIYYTYVTTIPSGSVAVPVTTIINTDLLPDGRVETDFAPFDTFDVTISADDPLNVYTVYLKAQGGYCQCYPSPRILLNAPVDMSAVLDNSRSVAELIKDIGILFNFYFLTDNKRKKVYIEPRDGGFYYGVEHSVDWSEPGNEKIDLSRTWTKDTLTSTFPRTWEFKFANDPNDKMVADWEEQNKQPYQSAKVELSEAFPKGTKTIETRHIAPTMMYKDYSITTPTLSPDGLSMPQLWQATADGEDHPEYTNEFNPRILYFAGLDNTQSFFWQGATNVYSGGFPVTYAVDPALDNSKVGLTWNDYTYTDGLGVTTIQEGCVTEFWGKYLTAVDTGFLLKCYANISAVDIASLLDDGNGRSLWRKPIFIRGSYFVLNAINDYDAAIGGSQLCPVELMQYSPYYAKPVPTRRKHPKDNNWQDTYAPKPKDPDFFPGRGVNSEYVSLVSPVQLNVASAVLQNGSNNQAPARQGCVVSGVGCIAVRPYQVIEGRYNLPHEDAIYQIGNGTSNTDRSNSWEIRIESGVSVIYKDGSVCGCG